MATVAAPSQRALVDSSLIRVALFFAVPLLIVATAAGAYTGREGLLLTALLAVTLLTLLFVHPTVGIVTMVSGFLMGSYPEVIRGAGVFTLNNVLGAGFGTLLLARWLQTRDFSFVRLPQVKIFAAIGVSFLISNALVPYKQVSEPGGHPGHHAHPRPHGRDDAHLHLAARVPRLLHLLRAHARRHPAHVRDPDVHPLSHDSVGALQRVHR
jgi:hypothetical protein